VIAYLDTSALVRLLLRDEEGAGLAGSILDASDVAVTSRIAHVEGRAALAAATRAGRLRAREHARSKRELGRAFRSLAIVEVHPSLVEAAGDVAERFDLRAYDAVHLASALVVDDGSTVVVTWDRALASAASAAGLDVAPPA
jgi:predicted nucleic acid-binding protein